MTAPIVFDTIQATRPALLPPSASVPVDDDDAASSLTSTARGNAAAAGKIEPKTGGKGLQSVASASAAVLGGAIPASHYASGHEKTVNFLGLYVVRGPTASKNVHYMMDISVQQWSLQFRIAQRFHSFRQLRQRLLRTLKHCPGTRRSNSECPVEGKKTEVMNGSSAGKELLRMISARASAPCACCSSTRKMVTAMKFPKRKFVFTNRQHIHERSLMLETFLSYCICLLLRWTGCKRGRRAWALLLGVFLDANLHECIRAEDEASKRDPSEDRATVDSAGRSSGGSSFGGGVASSGAPVNKAEVPMLVLPQHAGDLDSDYEHTTEAMLSFISIDSSAPPASSSAIRRQ
jgi:hypothetical protein